LDISEKDVAPVWVLANKFNLEDLLIECESAKLFSAAW